MRLSTVLLSCSTLLQCIAAKKAYLYTLGDRLESPSTILDTISADSAFLIIARRQAATDGLRLGNVDTETLSQISQYGGYQKRLFGEGIDATPERVLVTIQAENTESLNPLTGDSAFEINAPTKDLLDLGSRGMHGDSHSAISKEGVKIRLQTCGMSHVSTEAEISFLSKGESTSDLLKKIQTFLDSSKELERVSIDFDFTTSKLSQSMIKTHIDTIVNYLQGPVPISQRQPTLLILPPTTHLAIPNHKRTTPEEEPLEISPTTTNNEVTTNNDLSALANFTLPARFPACFTSKSACTNQTNSCSGHGSCRASGSNKNCYQCFCTRTVVRTNEDGSKKTTKWAGAACQKKDISVEFVLFAGFGVTMAALLMGVMGMMYSMGSQELPSVLGAGVSGPSAGRK